LVIGSTSFIGENKSGININSDAIEMLDFTNTDTTDDIFVNLDDNQFNYNLADVQTPDYIIFEIHNNEDEHSLTSNNIISVEPNEITSDDLNVYFDEEDGLEDGKTNFDDLLDLI
jgi:hypothetical protein